MRPALHVLLTSLFMSAACEVTAPTTVQPGCDISEETRVYAGRDIAESYVFVIDPEVRHMGPAHLARIEASLIAFMQLRVDGRLWFEPFDRYQLAPTVVRVAVILPDGTSVSTELPSPPPLPDDGEALMEDGMEVWVEHDAWKAWFLEAFALRIHDALMHEGSVLSTPVKAATRFAETHPYFANPHVIVVTRRDAASEMSASRTFPWLVVIGAAPNQPTSDGSREPWHDDIQTQLDLHGSADEVMLCDDGTAAGAFPGALLTSVRARQYTSFFSLCDFDLRRASMPSIATCLCSPPTAVARVYSAHPDGTVDCTMNILLPSAGPRRHCAAFGFRRIDLQGEAPFARERCEVPQLTHAELESHTGFHSVIDPTRDSWSQQLVIRRANIPDGTGVGIRCWRGNDACGFNGNFTDAGLDAR